MKKLIFIITVSALVICGCQKDADSSKTLVRKPVQVNVEHVSPGDFVRKVNYNGTVFPWKQANVIADVSGRIRKIHCNQGDIVARGEMLAELDTTTIELQRDQAAAMLAVAEASYKDAQLNARRINRLYAQKAVSMMQKEKADLGLESALTQKKSARATLNVIRHNLKSAKMRAPFAGIVTSKNMEEGDMINPMMGMGPGILTLMDISRVKIRLDVSAADIEKIENGQECEVRFSSFPGEVFSGKVFSKNLAADPASKTFRVEIEVKNPQMKIKAGVFADVSIEICREKNVLTLPLSALLGEDQIVLYNQGKARIIRIRVGQRNNERFEIVSGVEAGKKVVVEGNYDLKEGSLIKEAEDDK